MQIVYFKIREGGEFISRSNISKKKIYKKGKVVHQKFFEMFRWFITPFFKVDGIENLTGGDKVTRTYTTILMVSRTTFKVVW